jgi:uncharacterized membrane protein HdeD (DUF308 family)
MMVMFFATGIVGILVGLLVAPKDSRVIFTFMGVVNFALGAFFAWLLLTQTPDLNEKRKKKRNDN